MPIPHTPTAHHPSGSVNTTTAASFETFFYIGEGAFIDSYDIGVSTDPAFPGGGTHWNGTTLSAGLPSNQVSVAYGGTALSTGILYYWRVRAHDGAFVSPWSTTVTFEIDPAAPAPDPYSDWAYTILGQLKDGIGVTVLGTLIPEGGEVFNLLGSEFRDQYHVVDSYHGEPIDRYVETLGGSWSLTRDNGWTVDLVTQDLEG